jgi:hypothetical protein
MGPRISPSVQYIETAVLDSKQICAALGVSMATLNRLNLPTIYLGERSRRWIWGDVLNALRKQGYLYK